jgi:16S rRNA (cytosine1402-N4)-methyltransferase
MSYPHVSVLSREILAFFEDCSLHTFVDCTLGAGGHAEIILNSHPEIEKYLGIDQDPSSLLIAETRLKPWQSKTALLRGNFSSLDQFFNQLKIEKSDGILLDLGVSSMQLDTPEKGFSFMHDGPLDMRMDPENPLTAYELVNFASEGELGRIFRDYGEEKQWRRAARAIAIARAKAPIQTTRQLLNLLHPVLYKKNKPGINPATLVFQALRICVNRELEVLEAVLPIAIRRLRVGGRLAVISFHSLEDRIVKNVFRYEASDKENTTGIGGMFLSKLPTIKILTKKPAIAQNDELKDNPRSRSAKLRVIEKL